MPDVNSPLVSAKSDWYWQIGAASWIASHLFGGCADIAQERHHERVAGLYCLAVASAINATPARVIVCGNDEGAYVFPDFIDEGWANSLGANIAPRRLSIVDDAIAQGRISEDGINASAASSSNGMDGNESPGSPESGSPSDFDESEDTLLLLTDNAGVWTNHNPWLEGLAEAVVIACIGADRVVAVLRRAAGNNGLWRMTPTPLTVARLHGFEGQHLSIENNVPVPMDLLGDGLVLMD